MSLNELAQIAELPLDLLERIELGQEHDCELHIIIAIAEALHIRPSELFAENETSEVNAD